MKRNQHPLILVIYSQNANSMLRAMLPVIALGILAASFSLSCTGRNAGTAALDLQGIRQTAQFQLNIDDSSIYEAGGFSLEVKEQAELATAVVRASGVKDLKAVYFTLSYDPLAYSPIEAVPGTLLATMGSPLALTVTKDPGTVVHGQVLANWPEQEGIAGDGIVATFRFGPADGAPGSESQKSISAVPASDKAKPYLNFNPEASVFRWYYVNPGDYDQNGEVGISDLSPLGANFNAEGPFDVGSALSVIDGDGNGIINIADITPIGANFGNHIGEWAIYGSHSTDDYPEGNAEPNGAGSRQICNVPFSSAQGGGGQRKVWEYVMDNPVYGTGYYWLRPVSFGTEGTPSNGVPRTMEWHLTQLYDYGHIGADAGVLDLAIVAGKPAAVLMLVTSGMPSDTELLYMTAEDNLGTQWNSPQTAASVIGPGQVVSMAEIDGTPALLYYIDATPYVTRYIRAEDAEGTQWGSPYQVTSGYQTTLKLLEDDGRPVAVYHPGNLNVSLGLDAEGVTWLPPVAAVELVSNWGGRMGAVAVAGGIGVAGDKAVDGSLVYNRVSIDGITAVAGEPVVVFPGGSGENLYVMIGSAAGKPFVVTKRAQDKAYYSYALDETGSAWTLPSLWGLEGEIERLGVAGINDQPWACYYDGPTGRLRVGYASQPAPAEWDSADDVIDYPPQGGLVVTQIEMMQAGVHPAVGFVQTVEDTINYAVYY